MKSFRRLKKLNGNRITIELLPFHFIFDCFFQDNEVEITAHETAEPDAKITGTPLQMINVMLNKNNRQRAFADDLVIEGRAEIANEVVELFDELQIDWEEYVARIVGDAPAHYANRFVQSIGSFLGNVEQSFTQNVSEYVHEEKDWLPSRERLNDFFAEIDALRMDVDRAEAKINYLMKQYHSDDDYHNAIKGEGCQ